MHCMSSESAESRVEKGDNGCASVFLAAGDFPAISPLDTVD